MAQTPYSDFKRPEAGTPWYYALQWCQAPADAIQALYTWWEEVRQIPSKVSDPQLARIKLAWWKEEMATLFVKVQTGNTGWEAANDVSLDGTQAGAFAHLMNALDAHQARTEHDLPLYTDTLEAAEFARATAAQKALEAQSERPETQTPSAMGAKDTQQDEPSVFSQKKTPSHPLTKALAPYRQHFTQAAFEAALDAISAEIDAQQHWEEDWDENDFQTYLEHYGQGFLTLLMQLNGLFDPERTPPAIQSSLTPLVTGLGADLRYLDILYHLGGDVRRGLCLLPKEWLQAQNINPDQLLEPEMQEPLAFLLRQMGDYLKGNLQQHLKALKALPKAQRSLCKPLIILNKSALALIKALNKDGWQVMQHRIALIPLRYAWIAATSN